MTLTAWIALVLALGLALYAVAVAVLDPAPKTRPRHRAGDPPPEPQMWLEDDGKPYILSEADAREINAIVALPDHDPGIDWSEAYDEEDDCIVCVDDDITDIDDLPPDLADRALRSMRGCEADAVVRLRRAMETSDD